MYYQTYHPFKQIWDFETAPPDHSSGISRPALKIRIFSSPFGRPD
jgi:hypothetical protein